ncbi:unnamed protein product [Cutaneotrichosporon oleaginosum]
MSTAPLSVCPRSGVDAAAASGPAPSKAVLKSSRARPIKTQRGWGNLPSHPLQYAIKNLNLEHAHRVPETAHFAALAMVRRNWLSEMRLVSSGWSQTVKSHPFWGELITTMRPELAGVSGSPTFHTAHMMTKDVCFACRISCPSRRHLKALYRVPALNMRPLPTCDVHFGQFCSQCLRVQNADLRAEPNHFLRRPVYGDVDEHGIPRNCEGLLCAPCRDIAFNAALRRDLEACSRGGAVRGLDNPWMQTVAYKEHVFFGVGRSDFMARQAVDDWFLLQHTPYNQLVQEIGTVQAILRKQKVLLYESRVIQSAPLELAQISRIVWSVFDEEDQVAFDLSRLCRLWVLEMENKAYGDYEYRLDVERMRHNMSATALWPWLREKAVQRAVELWAQARFLNGYWVMPSDEIEQMLDPSQTVHTPLHEIACNVSRTSEYGNPLDRWHHGTGRFRYHSNLPDARHRERQIAQQFLPPDRLLQMMNMRFIEVVALRMDAALAEVVRPFTRLPYDEFDRIEAHLDTFTVPQIITLLEEPYPWFEAEDPTGRWPITIFPLPPASNVTAASTISEEEEPEEQSLAKEDDVTSEGQQRGAGSDVDNKSRQDDGLPKPSHQTEPIVEVVASTDDLPNCYGIVDGWSTTSNEHGEYGAVEDHEDCVSDRSGLESAADWSSPSSRLSSLKQSDDEAASHAPGQRSRLGSGQTSHSGGSSNTALITPDDSPPLLAHERIRVAEDDDATTDTTPIASLRVITTSPGSSPRLGKRKSPDDDDLIRPPRNVASIGTPSRPDDWSSRDTASPATSPRLGKRKSPDDDELVRPPRKCGLNGVRSRSASPSSCDDTEEDGVEGSDKMEQHQGKPTSASTEISGVDQPAVDAAMNHGMTKNEAKLNADAGKRDSESLSIKDEGLSEALSSAQDSPSGVVKVARAVGVPEGAWTRAESECSELYDSLSEASMDSDKLAEVPSVPPPWAKLGPGVEDLLESTWYRSRELLRICRCGICMRAKYAAEAMRQNYDVEDDIMIMPPLRIA